MAPLEVEAAPAARVDPPPVDRSRENEDPSEEQEELLMELYDV